MTLDPNCRYLNRVDAALKATDEQTSGGPVTIIAHSAGGWLGRIYLLGFGTQGRVDRFISLGSPHLPPLKVAPWSLRAEPVPQWCPDFGADSMTAILENIGTPLTCCTAVEGTVESQRTPEYS